MHILATFSRWYVPAGTALLLLLAGCVMPGQVSKLDSDNQVQNQRLAAIERSSGREIETLSQQLETMRRQLRSSAGQLQNMSSKLDKLLKEQTAIADSQEKTNAQGHSVRRRMDRMEKENAILQRSQKKELDAMRISMAAMVKLMKSPISGLPSKTKADKMFREAFSNMVGGQLDIAADQFDKFTKTYKQDRRAPEAVYRGGQAFFLMRKYDHATVLFLEMVEKHGKHKLAVDARWMLARSLEETGDLRLARDLYAELISGNTIHKADATRRVYFINELYPKLKQPRGKGGPPKRKKSTKKKSAKKKK